MKLEGKLEFMWDIFLKCDVINYVCLFFYMKNIYLRYTETVPIKKNFIVRKIISQKNIILFFLKICLTKLIKKRRINFQISKGKIQTFQKFLLREFLRFPTDP